MDCTPKIVNFPMKQHSTRIRYVALRMLSFLFLRSQPWGLDRRPTDRPSYLPTYSVPCQLVSSLPPYPLPSPLFCVGVWLVYMNASLMHSLSVFETIDRFICFVSLFASVVCSSVPIRILFARHCQMSIDEFDRHVLCCQHVSDVTRLDWGDWRLGLPCLFACLLVRLLVQARSFRASVLSWSRWRTCVMCHVWWQIEQADG